MDRKGGRHRRREDHHRSGAVRHPLQGYHHPTWEGLMADAVPIEPGDPLRAAELKDALLQAITDLGRPAPAGAAPSAGPATAGNDLRFALAVRGPADPKALLPKNLDEAARLDLLDTVAVDCDTGAGTSLGQWLLSDAARRRELTARSPDEIRQALEQVPPNDPIATALRHLYRDDLPDLDALSAAELRALLSVLPAVTGLMPGVPQPTELHRRLAKAQRRENFENVVKDGFVGRDSELRSVLSVCIRSDANAGDRFGSCLVWGTGGIGKSTLISAVMLHLLGEDEGIPGPSAARPDGARAIVVHLDFDRSDLDVMTPIGLSLELLRQAGLGNPGLDAMLKERREIMRAELHAGLDGAGRVALEAASTPTVSAMHNALEWTVGRGQALVLVLDTFEQVEAAGPPGLESLDRWIDDLLEVSGALAIRLVVAGRTDPTLNGTAKMFQRFGHVTEIHLDDLPESAAVPFLTGSGMSRARAKALHSALGGNPLVLRLIRKLAANRRKVEELQDIADDVQEGKIPKDIVQGILYDRFLGHIHDREARTYAHPGLVLPELTPTLIRQILAPLKSQRAMPDGRAEAIFNALAEASWLVRREGDRLIQHADVRRLMLRLMAADQGRAAEVRRVRQMAILHHHGRLETEHRAALAYHLLMDARSREDLELLQGIDLSGCGHFLRRYREDLPVVAKTFVDVVDFSAAPGPGGLRVTNSASVSADRAVTDLPDGLWCQFIACDGGGEGDRLVDRTDPGVALELWRRRPVGPPGRPPTFVLQALAETAEWDTDEVDLAAVVNDLHLRMSEQVPPPPPLLRRLYWISRLALCKDPDSRRFTGALPGYGKRLVELMGSALRSPSADQMTALPTLAAVMEALLGGIDRIIPDSHFDNPRRGDDSNRIFLQRAVWLREELSWQANTDSLVVLQRNFAKRAADQLARVPSPPGDLLIERLVDAQTVVDATDGTPLSSMTKALSGLRSVVAIDVDGMIAETMPGWTLVLRGQTSELHRPARQALVEGFAGAGQDRLREVAQRWAALMTIRPLELELDAMVRRLTRNPMSGFLTLVQFADRARVLESLLREARRFALRPRKIERVLATLVDWDRAITGGRSSDWWAEKGPNEAPVQTSQQEWQI
ncbi:ATP-binding protein [Azospirillum sp. Vi22]|nr:ATP-binding protein [Azospirillum baldaniorum]